MYRNLDRKNIFSRLFSLLVTVVALGFAAMVFSQSPHGPMGTRGEAREAQIAPVGTYIPQRVYDANEKRFSDFEGMLAELAKTDVVFFGEQHDDPATHRLERAILEGLARRRQNIVVAMEMFERDVQRSLDDYLAGGLSEDEFLRISRPWPNYLTDYRPIVEFARAHNWSVVASNVPRRYAAQVSRQGLAAVDAVPAAERHFIAAQFQCPYDDYFKRFSEAMGAMGASPHGANGATGGGSEAGQNEERRAMLERFYLAQCVKDETMAESIAEQFQDSTQSKPLIVHFNGAFHSDYRLGTAARASRRLPKSKIKVLTVVPVDNLDTIKADEYRKLGDYIIFSLKTVESGQAQSTEVR